MKLISVGVLLGHYLLSRNQVFIYSIADLHSIPKCGVYLYGHTGTEKICAKCVNCTFHADGGVLREVYDVCGNLLKRILPESYDRKSDDGAGYSYAYDACNRLVEIKNPLGIVEMRYVYDLCGNIIKEIPAKGYLMGDTDETRIGTLYRYDLRGNVTEIRVPLVVEEDGSVSYCLTTFRYDKLNNCVEEKRFQDYQSRERAHGRVNIIRYGYDKGGRLVTISDSTGAQIEYAYNERNQRIMEKQKISGSIWQERHYEYSPAGNIIRVAESADEKGCSKKYVSTRFSYDKNGNITRIQTPTGHEILREYDVCDRLTAETHKEKKDAVL